MKHPRHSEHGCLVRYKECIDNRSVTTILSKVIGISSHFTHTYILAVEEKCGFMLIALLNQTKWLIEFNILFPTVAILDACRTWKAFPTGLSSLSGIRRKTSSVRGGS